MTTQRQALVALNSWLADRGQETGSSTEEAWNISPYKEGFVLSPAGGARSNLLYVVVDDMVKAFSPATTSIEEAYVMLTGTENNDKSG